MTLKYTLDASKRGPFVNPNIYGHFAEHLGRGIYEGIWVGEESSIPNTRGLRNDVLDALRSLQIPVLRWPGGCFADEYHWRDGIGPRSQRPAMINTHWGGVVENNHFGTHEFLDLCEQIGAAPYVCGNVGSGTVREMMEWVEYISSDADSPVANERRRNGRHEPWKLPYFGVGNESWGCGGNMRPEYYADEFRRYNTFVKNYPGNRIYRIACGANSTDVRWTGVLMERAGSHMDGLSLHYYTLCDGWPPKGSATQFSIEEWNQIMRAAYEIDRIVREHIEVMDRHDPAGRVGLVVDEWGTWFECEPDTNPGFLYQQNSIRDAVVAALTFHVFHRHAQRVVMANIAQLVNVLQASVLTDGDRMLKTPTYWVFEMFAPHQGGEALLIEADAALPNLDYSPAPRVSASATLKGDAVHVTWANLDPQEGFYIQLGAATKSVKGRLLSGDAMTDHNTFERPDRVVPASLPLTSTSSSVGFELPRHSVAALELRL